MSDQLLIVKSKIVVAAIPHTPAGYTVDHLAKGILPRCRKLATLFISTSYGTIWVKNLYSHNGSARIRPIEWEDLIRRTPVVSSDFFPFPLTPEVIEAAYQHVLSVTTCAAVTNDSDIHPNFQPSYDPLKISQYAFEVTK